MTHLWAPYSSTLYVCIVSGVHFPIATAGYSGAIVTVSCVSLPASDQELLRKQW